MGMKWIEHCQPNLILPYPPLNWSDSKMSSMTILCFEVPPKECKSFQPGTDVPSRIHFHFYNLESRFGATPLGWLWYCLAVSSPSFRDPTAGKMKAASRQVSLATSSNLSLKRLKLQTIVSQKKTFANPFQSVHLRSASCFSSLSLVFWSLTVF